jgi:surface protein
MSDSLAFNSETLLYNNLYELYYIDYNPLNLPPYTIRVELLPDAVEPCINMDFRNDKLTMTQVSASPNIWDITYTDSVWDLMFDVGVSPGIILDNVKGIVGGNLTGVTSIIRWFYSTDILEYINIIDTPEIIDMTDAFKHCTNLVNIPRYFNLVSVVDMTGAFSQCYSLVHLPEFVNSSNLRILKATFGECISLIDIPLFDTSNVTDFEQAFEYCRSLKEVPLLDVSSVTNCPRMFATTINVESGSLALYNRLQALGAQITEHGDCFENCGSDTVTGAAELAQIPSGWK